MTKGGLAGGIVLEAAAMMIGVAGDRAIIRGAVGAMTTDGMIDVTLPVAVAGVDVGAMVIGVVSAVGGTATVATITGAKTAGAASAGAKVMRAVDARTNGGTIAARAAAAGVGIPGMIGVTIPAVVAGVVVGAMGTGVVSAVGGTVMTAGVVFGTAMTGVMTAGVVSGTAMTGVMTAAAADGGATVTGGANATTNVSVMPDHGMSPAAVATETATGVVEKTEGYKENGQSINLTTVVAAQKLTLTSHPVM